MLPVAGKVMTVAVRAEPFLLLLSVFEAAVGYDMVSSTKHTLSFLKTVFGHVAETLTLEALDN